MRKINKLKILAVFCFAAAIISLGVYGLVSTQYPGIYVVPPAYDSVHDSGNAYAAATPNQEALVTIQYEENEDELVTSQYENYEDTEIVPIVFDCDCVVREEVLNNTFDYEETSVLRNYIYTEIVPPMYDAVRGFSNGYAVVEMGRVWNDEMWYWERGLFGLIDREGNLVLPVIYDRIGDIFDTVVVDDCVFVIVTYNGKRGIMNVHGDVILPLIYTRVSVRDNLATVFNGAGDDRTGGLFNLSTREFVIPERNENDITQFLYGYDDTFGFWNNMAAVSRDGRWGVIDTEGNYVLEPMFDYMTHLQQYVWREDFRYIPVPLNGLSGVWDITEGRLVVPHIYISISDIYANSAIVYYGEWPVSGDLNIESGVLNIETGEYIIPLGYMHIEYNTLRNGLTFASKGTEGHDLRIGVVDIRTGEVLVDFMYDHLRWERGVESNYIIFQEGAEWERSIWAGGEFYALVGGLFGVMDAYGNIIVPAIYSSILYMHGSLDLFAVTLWCERNGIKMGVINGSGEIVLPIEYTLIDSFWHSSGFLTGFAPVNIGADWVWDKNANEVDGSGMYVLRGGKWGFIDTSGNLVVPAVLEYDLVYSVTDGMAAVMRDSMWGFISVRADA